MKKINLERKALEFCKLAMAKKDIRYYLNALCIELNGDKARFISTDGHRLNTCVHDIENEGVDVLIIDRDIILSVLRLHDKKVKTLELVIDHDYYSLGGVVFVPMSARFPDWRRVVPDDLSGEAGQFNPNYLLDAQKSLAVWHDSTPTKFHKYNISHNGIGGAAIMRGNDDNAFVVIMGMRPSAGDSNDPYAFPVIDKPVIESIADNRG